MPFAYHKFLRNYLNGNEEVAEEPLASHKIAEQIAACAFDGAQPERCLASYSAYLVGLQEHIKCAFRHFNRHTFLPSKWTRAINQHLCGHPEHWWHERAYKQGLSVQWHNDYRLRECLDG